MSQPALDPKALLLEELLADAIRRNHQEAFDLRLRQGACVKALAPGREPPLALACYWDRLEMGKALLERGADPNERCLDGTIPLSQCIGGPSPLFELLLHISDLTVRDEHGANAWTWLCQNARNLDAATLRSRMEALRHIAEPSFIDSRGKSCLDLALRSRHPELVEACLDLGLGAEPSAQSPVLELYPSWDWEPGGRARLLNKAMDKFPLTPQGAALGVGWCLDFGDAELFEFLLPLADKPEPDALGHLLLHRAARGREAALVRRVLEIERPFCDASGRDPLMVAIEGGRSENALLLLPHCDLLAVDALGESALDKARLNGLEEVEREIRMRLRAQLEAGFLSQHVAPLAARPALSL